MEIEENQNNIIEIEIDKETPKDSVEEEKKLENKTKNNIIIIENDEYIEEMKEKEKLRLSIITKYSNLSPELFSNEFILDYKCISCGLIPSFEKANETICCGYLICEECLEKFNEEKKGCPICNIAELKARDIKKENKIFYKSLKNLIIKCPYNCEWKGMWVDLEAHLNECKLGYKECKYKVLEHEKSNDKYHLELALKFIKDKKIEKKKIQFELGETCMTTCHPHIMKYMKYLDWSCDGRRLEHGCYSKEKFFSSHKPRFRCIQCDFDLCDKCIVHYVV